METLPGVTVSCASPEFPGFPDFRANVTFVPLQFFTAVLPHRSRSCVRIVGYMLRRILGWVDQDGNPTASHLQFTYRELMESAGVSRDSIHGALAEAREFKLILCQQSAHAKAHGQDARSAVYSLRWSKRYTNHPGEFDGFFSGEAVAEGSGDGVQARAARKNIPDAFFDYVLRRERLSVLRVVGTLLFRSIQWGEGGERKVPISLSISELCRLTRLARRHVHEAVTAALERGYVVCLQEGHFDPQGGQASHAATYAIRWTRQAQMPTFRPGPPEAPSAPSVRKGIRDQSEKGNGSSVRKGARDRSEKGYGDRSEKGNDISINSSVNSTPAAAPTPLAPPPAAEPARAATAAAAVEGVWHALVEAGFDRESAAHLSRAHAAEVIERQLSWLPLRQVRQNRLGLLRRAIEQDWPKPEGPKRTPASLFVAQFAAAVHGLAEPMFCVTGHGIAEAEVLLGQLADGSVSESEAAEWGRRFGKFATRHRPGKTSFVWCARECGPEFIRIVHRGRDRAKRQAAAKTHEAEMNAQYDRYDQFLIETLRLYRREKPEFCAQFQAEQNRNLDQLGAGPCVRQGMANELAQASAFADFARDRGESIPTLAEWLLRPNRHIDHHDGNESTSRAHLNGL